ncbi:hypothetical protein SLA2020_094010 [Shorea laevis]
MLSRPSFSLRSEKGFRLCSAIGARTNVIASARLRFDNAGGFLPRSFSAFFRVITCSVQGFVLNLDLGSVFWNA